MKFLITDCGMENRGGEVLVTTAYRLFKNLVPNSIFSMSTSNPSYDNRIARKLGVNTFEYSFRAPHKALYNLFLELVDTDVVLHLAGFAFSDNIRKRRKIFFKSLSILLATFLRKNVVVYSQSLGPFNSRFVRIFEKIVLSKADIIVTRGRLSKAYLQNLGVNKRVYIFPDCGFLLEPVASEHLQTILQREGIKLDSSLRIGIAVNTRIYERRKNYIDVLAKFCDQMIENVNAQIIFIPHEYRSHGYDDRSTARLVGNKIKNKQNVHLVENEYDARELKSLVGIFDLFIGSRFHSIVASTSMCIPTIVIAWAHKYLETMQLLGQQDNVLDYKKLTTKQLVSLTHTILARKKEIKKQLKAKVSEARNSVLYGARLVVEDFIPFLNIQRIAEQLMCVGCGTCKAICPDDAIQLNVNERGFYVPFVDASKCSGCGLCLRVCPSST